MEPVPNVDASLSAPRGHWNLEGRAGCSRSTCSHPPAVVGAASTRSATWPPQTAAASSALHMATWPLAAGAQTRGAKTPTVVLCLQLAVRGRTRAPWSGPAPGSGCWEVGAGGAWVRGRIPSPDSRWLRCLTWSCSGHVCSCPGACAWKLRGLGAPTPRWLRDPCPSCGVHRELGAGAARASVAPSPVSRSPWGW